MAHKHRLRRIIDTYRSFPFTEIIPALNLSLEVQGRPHITARDTDTFLSIVQMRAAMAFDNISEATIHQMHGAGNFTAYGVNGRGKGFKYNGAYALTVTPATIVVSTPVINVQGTLKNVFNTPGCNVSFRGVYVKRID
ncbi:MAG TPA: hypothetical protein VHD14_11720 [Pseudolabrys sp.]|nr:hypothetical protein [Pseudolabrys sp.]